MAKAPHGEPQKTSIIQRLEAELFVAMKLWQFRFFQTPKAGVAGSAHKFILFLLPSSYLAAILQKV